MADARKPPPTLADLRREIDRIDEAMHRLLMERGDIIDTLIATKKTAESGSAFRPAREADMMRRLVGRHRGILPLDTAESIWRVIIATFTYVQAPFSVHADLSAGEAAMRDTARFHFGFTVPFIAHLGATGVVAAGTSGLTTSARVIQKTGAPFCCCTAPDIGLTIFRLPRARFTPEAVATFCPEQETVIQGRKNPNSATPLATRAQLTEFMPPPSDNDVATI